MSAVNILGKDPTIARTLTVTGTSSGVTLTATCRRISIMAIGATMLFKIGPGAQTATAADHHIINGERLIFDISKGSSIAAIRHAGTNGTLEISEFA
jgi:hypothetical protein